MTAGPREGHAWWEVGTPQVSDSAQVARRMSSRKPAAQAARPASDERRSQASAADRFLVIGRAGMDFYADPAGARPRTRKNSTAALGGSAANIAVGLSSSAARRRW